MKFLLAEAFEPLYAIIDLKKTTLTIADGSTTPNTIEVSIGEGNLTYTEKRNIEYMRDKGSLDTVREGDEEPVEVRMDFQWIFLVGTTTTVVTIEQAIKGTGSNWVTAATDTCEPYACDLALLYEPDCSTTKNETITFSDFRWESLEHDTRQGQISCSGNCNEVSPTIVRTAPS